MPRSKNSIAGFVNSASMAKLISKLRQLFGLAAAPAGGHQTAAGDLPPVKEILDDGVVTMLMQMLEHTDEQEYNCEETFALLDQYVELAAKDDNAAALMPLVQRHIDLCVDCKDEFQMLLRVLQSDTTSPAP